MSRAGPAERVSQWATRSTLSSRSAGMRSALMIDTYW